MSELAAMGAYVDLFYNDSLTYTSRAIPALWCGGWTGVRDTVYEGISTQYTLLPSFFEYYRKHAQAPAKQCYYVLKQINSLWLPSFHPDYGPDYWPTFLSAGSTDADVLDHTLLVMESIRPQFLLVYFADVDSYGHSGNWANYTAAIQRADSIVGVIWDRAQKNPGYAGKTTLLVTNDHGRHDPVHGGFRSHGDGCPGCRQIMLLAVGPKIKAGYISHEYRSTPDMAVTVLDLLGIEAEYATGEVMRELYADLSSSPDRRQLASGYFLMTTSPNPFNSSVQLRYTVPDERAVSIAIYDLEGRQVKAVAAAPTHAGRQTFIWDGRWASGRPADSGIYFCRIVAGKDAQTIKLLLLK